VPTSARGVTTVVGFTISQDRRMDSSGFPIFAQLVPCLASEFVDNQSRCGFAPNKSRGRRVMLLKLRRLTAVLAAALTLAAASIPTNAEAQGYYGPGYGGPAYVGAGDWGRGAWGGDGPWRGGGWDNAGWGGCGCCCRRVWVPPPPPPPPPRCCCCGGYGGVGYGGGYYGGGDYGW
jgi:hypothetical protein